MRTFAIALVAGLVLLFSQAMAADRGGVRAYGGSAYGSAYDDGPYYITPSGDGFYAECGRPKVPYPEDGYGPAPNTTFLGPVGYRCIRGRYADDPFYPPRCRTAFISGPNGWSRVRRCN